ncbi:MAG: hypothetical protein ACPL0C_02905 [Candidatus Bathyarchaeales archaeon]
MGESGLTEEEQAELEEFRREWRKTLNQNKALGATFNIETVPYKRELMLFYRLQTIAEKCGPGFYEKRFIGLAEDLTLKDVTIRYYYNNAGLTCDSTVKPVDYKNFNLTPEAVAKLALKVIRGEAV